MLDTLIFLFSSPSHLASFALGVLVTFSLKLSFAIFDTARLRNKLKDLLHKHKARINALKTRLELETKHNDDLLAQAYSEKSELYAELERVIKEKENLISSEIERLKKDHAFELENLHAMYKDKFI